MLLFSACSSTQLLQSVLAWCNKICYQCSGLPHDKTCYQCSGLPHNKTCYQCSGLPHNAIHSDSKVIWKLQRSVRSFRGLLAGLKDYLRGLQLELFQTPLTTLVFNHVSFFQEKGKAKIYLGKPKQAPHWSRQWLRTWNSGIYMCLYLHVCQYVSFILCLSLPSSWDRCMLWNALCIPVCWYESHTWLSRQLNSKY